MKNNTIAVGCDHAGVEYKKAVISLLHKKGYNIIDNGTNTEDSVDYPDFVHPVCEQLEKGEAAQGIILCGSGNGACMTANKHQQIRAALCWTNELASLARQHNNANILSIPARFVSLESCLEMVETFLTTDFEGGRHQRRVDKIACL